MLLETFLKMMLLNVSFGSDLSERSITRTRLICQPPVTNYNGTYFL